ncbi:hypothetical protein DFJ77DRAFT_471672 [Powellomyces hirtus]|nr:hypothetical protein DFJ77DRAFT_471672 [Powellomyces hirtus]
MRRARPGVGICRNLAIYAYEDFQDYIPKAIDGNRQTVVILNDYAHHLTQALRDYDHINLVESLNHNEYPAEVRVDLSTGSGLSDVLKSLNITKDKISCYILVDDRPDSGGYNPRNPLGPAFFKEPADGGFWVTCKCPRPVDVARPGTVGPR